MNWLSSNTTAALGIFGTAVHSWFPRATAASGVLVEEIDLTLKHIQDQK